MSYEKLSIYRELNWIGYKMTKWLRLRGQTAFYSSVNKKVVRTMRAPFDHLPAMYMAGLGTMDAERRPPPDAWCSSLLSSCSPASPPGGEEISTTLRGPRTPRHVTLAFREF